MTEFSTILSLLQFGAGMAIISAVVVRDRRRRREEEETERRIYKTGVWMNDL